MKKLVLILSLLYSFSMHPDSSNNEKKLTDPMKYLHLGQRLKPSALSLWLRPELLFISAQSPHADNGQFGGFQSTLLNNPVNN